MGEGFFVFTGTIVLFHNQNSALSDETNMSDLKETGRLQSKVPHFSLSMAFVFVSQRSIASNACYIKIWKPTKKQKILE